MKVSERIGHNIHRVEAYYLKIRSFKYNYISSGWHWSNILMTAKVAEEAARDYKYWCIA